MFSRFLYKVFLFLGKFPKIPKYFFFLVIVMPVVSFAGSLLTMKIYQNWGDLDFNRGAMAMMDNGAHGENFSTPIYLYENELKKNSKHGKSLQGWNKADSLWFYNTTQGSALLPYDFFLSLEKANSSVLLSSPENMDAHRYLPQRKTNFNPDGLPVGFAKESYRGRTEWYDVFKPSKDYVGYTCAACHTSQINFKSQDTETSAPAIAIRIDGGPAMADMVGFLQDLETALKAASSGRKGKDFVQKVLSRKNDYKTENSVKQDLEKWTRIISSYNQVNQSPVDYYFARLDAFGRIYNRTLQNTITVNDARKSFGRAFNEQEQHFLTNKQVDYIFDGETGDVLMSDTKFSTVIDRLNTLNLSDENVRNLLNASIFNEANAPVSYPFLWDVGQADYVQWNGIASNAALGPLGRNAGEVIGVFGMLDWRIEDNKRSSLSAFLTGQEDKSRHMTFNSSIDINNLKRLERKLQTLKSPIWPEHIFGEINTTIAFEGEKLYVRYCRSCHQVIDSRDADRHIIGKMFDINIVGTDPKSALNGVDYTGNSGNFSETYQTIAGIGNVVVEQEAPVVQILTAATKGVIGTPNRDKLFIRRWLDRLYNLAAAFSDNKIKPSVKAGDYTPDSSAKPYASLLAYKARPLNGIWATAPYLHNGSVPTLYDLLLPSRCGLSVKEQTKIENFRPDIFKVGSRAFDPNKVGFRYTDGKFQDFDTGLPGNSNCGHEYGTGGNPGTNAPELETLTDEQRWEIIEYIKTLSLNKVEE